MNDSLLMSRPFHYLLGTNNKKLLVRTKRSYGIINQGILRILPTNSMNRKFFHAISKSLVGDNYHHIIHTW